MTIPPVSSLISNLPVASVLTGSEPVPLDQPANGVTKRASTQAIANLALFPVATIAVLRAFVAPSAPSAIVVDGYHAAADGGGGVFLVGPDATDNSGTIINDALGRSWYRQSYGILTIQMFGGGTNDTVADNYPVLQNWLNDPSSRGQVMTFPAVGSNLYNFSRAFTAMSDHAIIVPSPDTVMFFAATAAGLQWPIFGAVVLGWGSYPNIRRCPVYALNAIAIGDNGVTCTTAAQAALFEVEDVCIVETVSTFNNGIENIATTQQINVVQSVDPSTGLVSLRHNVEFASSSCQIRRATRTGVVALLADGVTPAPGNEQVTAVCDFSIIGGAWQTVDGNPFDGAGMACDCVVRPSRVIAGYGVGYANLLGYCHVTADYEVISNTCFELSYGSHDNTCAIGAVDIQGSASVNHVIGFNEGARANIVSVGSINFGDASLASVVEVSESQNCRIDIQSIVGVACSAQTVLIQEFTYTGTAPACSENTVHVEKSNVGSQVQYVYMGGSNTFRCRTTGRFFGTVTASGGVVGVYSDTGTDHYFDGYIQNGNILSASTGFGYGNSYDYTKPVQIQTILTANLPFAANYKGGLYVVTDVAGGAALAISDGTHWRVVEVIGSGTIIA